MNILKTLIVTSLVVSSFNSFAESGASDHASQASKHSALSVYHGSAATAKLGSAVVAVPLIVGGTVALSTGLALESSSQSTTKVEKNAPLKITEKTITAAPSPKEMMKTSNDESL